METKSSSQLQIHMNWLNIYTLNLIHVKKKKKSYVPLYLHEIKQNPTMLVKLHTNYTFILDIYLYDHHPLTGN